MFLLMPRLNLNLNLANFFSLPILIGCAVDGAVHVLHRFRETGSTRDVGRTTGTAVCLAGLSNLLGFASMGLARHRGVASLGFVTALGCFTLLVSVLILLPALIEVFGARGRGGRQPSLQQEPEPAAAAVEEQAQP
jgi:predicted RND superfamily exporter protein